MPATNFSSWTRRPKVRARLLTAAALAALLAGGLQTGPGLPAAKAAVVADLASADALPTPQVNGIVFSVAIVGNTAYAAGNFTTARPSGVAAGGAGEVARTNLLAFDLTTGALLPFAHTIEGSPFVSTTSPGPYCDATGATNTYVCDAIFRVKASPDGKKIYVVGDFTKVDGQNRYRAAAFDTTTGALDPTFKPALSSRTRALAVGTSAVYLGGSFTAISGAARTRLAAVDLTGKVITSFAPTADNEVYAAALSQNQDRLVVGGRFATLAGLKIQGLGSVFTADGTLAPWSSRPIVVNSAADPSYVSDVQVSGATAFVSGVGRIGYPSFEGRLAADVDTGNLLWIDDCHGDTQSIAVGGGVVYSASHAHDCSRMGGAPIADSNGKATWVYQRLLAENVDAAGVMPSGQTVSKLESWFPLVDAGPSTSPWKNGPWALAADGVNVVVGGEFLTVNGVAQQGLTRFTARSQAPRKVGPSLPWPAPALAAAVAGQVKVTWLSTWDRDNPTLSYQVLRDNVLLQTFPVTTTFWNRPTLTFTDTGLVGGSVHTYRVRAIDPDGNAIGSPTSAPVTVLAGTPRAEDYAAQVVADGAQHYWRLSSSAGTDLTGGLSLVPGAGVTFGQPAGVTGTTDGSAAFDGTTAGVATTAKSLKPPSSLSVEAWFKTSSTAGGRIVGFGNSGSTTPSTVDDRHVYLTSDGRVNFGVRPSSSGTFQKISSTRTYNDGLWHQVVATLGSAGMVLYVDGAPVASKTSQTSATSYTGYWRVGGDTLAGWTAAYWGDLPKPPSPGLQTENWPWATSDDLSGSIDEVAVYASQLTAAQVLDHFQRGAL